MADFDEATQKGALAGIGTLSNDIYNDVAKDPAVNGTTQAWAACMARNGYTFKQPQSVFVTEIQATFGAKHSVSLGEKVSSAANEAQIATAVTDANCSDATDLTGIYFAVLASYEQQIVNANAAALADAVRQFRAAFGAELRKLPGLLKTTRVQPYPQVQGGQSVKPGQPTSAAR